MSVATKRRESVSRMDALTRIDRAVLGKAKAVATHRGVKLGKLLAEILSGPVDRAYANMLRELDRTPPE
jgi:hypothetical protein